MILPVFSAFAQQRIRLRSSDSVEGGRRDGERYNKVTGNVRFIQGTTEISCDSAFFYRRENSLEAFGHIHIFDQKDSTSIRSDRLYYSGDMRQAQLRDNVIYIDDSVILYTDNMDYNMIDKSAHYFNGGRILNGRNELTSSSGYYDSNSKNMRFYKKVVFENPENTLKADTLYYNLLSDIARTEGPTTIISADGQTVYSEQGGEFLMQSRRITIQSGTIETESFILKGNRLFDDKSRGINRAEGDVYMYSKADDIIITGDHAENDQVNKITKVYGNPVMKKIFMQDTLYLAADTLVSVDIKADSGRYLLAYHHVRFFRTDLQGIADSLCYDINDSILYLFNDPVLWNTGNQIEADSINIIFRENQIERMNLTDNAFIVLTDTVGNLNQLKGKIMTGHFENNIIDRLDVDGNSESLFYALDEEDNSLTGINRILCSSMAIRFVNSKADNMTFYTNPEARFIPPHQIAEPDRHLAGFNWRQDERPTLQDVLEPIPAEDSMSEETTKEITAEK